jgi:PAS domain S-box-containing protein
VEAVFAVLTLRRVPGFQPALDRFLDVVALAAVAGVVGSAIGATAGVASLALGGVLSARQLASTWMGWWTGSLIGDLVVAPPILAWALRPRPSLRRGRLAEAALLAALLLGGSAAVLSERVVVPPVVLFLPVVWAAVRFEMRGAATAVLVVVAVEVAGAAMRRGVALRFEPSELFFALHAYMATVSLCGLSLGAIVAERRRSSEALRKSEELLRAVTEGTSDAVFIKDLRGRYLFVNPAAARTVGASEAALLGKPEGDFFPPDEALAIRAVDEEVMRTGKPWRSEKILTFRGAQRVMQASLVPCRDRAGAIIGIIGISRDITEQRVAQEAEARLAIIVETSADAIISTTLDGTIRTWNAGAEHLFGYMREEAIGRSLALIIPPEELGRLARMVDQVARGEPASDAELTHLCKDGSNVEVSVSAWPIRDARGTVIGTAGIGRDVRESVERLRLAIEAAQLGMWFWNTEKGSLHWTSLCRVMHGVGPNEEVSYARFLSALHPEDRGRVEADVSRALSDRSDYRVEYRAVWPDGTVRWIAVLGRVVNGKAGEPPRMMGAAQDVTAHKQAEAERAELLERERAARAEAQAATRAKDDFLAMLSHELRTPLQAMLGWTLMLEKRARDAAAVEKGLSAIERAVRTQAQLIEDLLDVSRIVAGKLRVERRRVDPTPIVEAALEAGRAAAEAKSIHVEASFQALRGSVLGDPDRLQQVVSNLITNSVKFTPAGGHVRVRLERRARTVRIVVEDDGCGIPPEFLPHVFDAFRQGEGATTRRHGGLGLGLSIVRYLVEAHSGTVEAASEGEGRGARFTVTLPLLSNGQRAVSDTLAEGGASAARGAPALGGVRVLVVDDDPHACEMLEAVLRDEGADVHSVQSGRAALDDLGLFRPEVLVSDIGMPEMDGHTLLRHVRAREAEHGGHVEALALTALASPADRARALEVGFGAYLAKPVSPRELTAAVAGLMGR